MKTVLGLDLGVGSIGWALISVTDNNEPISILAIGVRRIPIDLKDSQNFCKGISFTKNQDRTKRHNARKGYDRYKQRREKLTNEFRTHNMLPGEELIKLPVLDLWQLRARAAVQGEKLSLAEIGRILYHINQRRGYKHGKADVSGDTKQRDYVRSINDRYKAIQELNQTIGQYFAARLMETAVHTDKGTFYTFRIKEQVFPREAYEEEFDRIMMCQKEFYPEIFTDQYIDFLRNHVIFYQRKLKSCKHLVSLCEFEKKPYINKKGETVFDGPKVIAKSNPLFQIDKIWEAVNNICLQNKNGDELFVSLEQKKRIVDVLQKNPVLKLTELYKILGITKRDGWFPNKSLTKGLKGNSTLIQLCEALQEESHKEDMLRFDLITIPTNVCDKETGEILQEISPECIDQPLYKLWHTVYSIQDKTELKSALRKNFNIKNENTVDKLFNIDFKKEGYGNKSLKMIRRILPYLQEGLKYSDACKYIEINHSNSLTKEENEARTLLNQLPHLEKNELRQPIVEKVLNQMVNIVNAVVSKYGRPDTIRVELGRELKQSRDERRHISDNIAKKERENQKISKLLKEDGIRPTRNRIERYRLWEEAGKKCFYCETVIGNKDFLLTSEIETEHIIPKALFFDNSYSNKVCACKKCNRKKNNMTGYDYMLSLSEDKFENYLNRVHELFTDGKISKTKRDRLFMKGEDIPQDFINRDLRLTQYISKKAMEILHKICYDVVASTGSVTDFIRHTWGYDEILHHLNFERYQQGRLTEWIEFEHREQTHSKEIIKEWSKRLDHRHHAIDALVVAMTSQSVIQRLNTLNTSREVMFQEIVGKKEEWKQGYSLLQQWLRERKHFSVLEVQNAISNILVSCKYSRKVTTPGKRWIYKNGRKTILQTGILVPRDALHEDSLYGRIRRPDNFEEEYVIKYKLGVGKMGFLFTGEETYEEKKAKGKNGISEVKITDKINNVLESIVDGGIRMKIRERLNEGFSDGLDYRNDPKRALNNLRNLEEKPVYADRYCKIPIKSVRCYTGLSAVVPVRFDDKGKSLGFVKPGNNHHVAIYRDQHGDYHERVVTFWQAVERKRYQLPVIVDSPSALWDEIQDKEIPETLLATLPEPNWEIVISLQQNENWILGMEEDDYQEAIEKRDHQKLNGYLYSVQNISSLTYRFSLLTTAAKYDVRDANKPDNRFLNIQSIKRLLDLNPHRIRISLLGEIIDMRD